MKHHCHALGCKAACPPAHLMCRACWAQVPSEMQAEVYRTVALRGKAVDATWAPWWRAQARAIHHVAMLRAPSPKGALYLARELAFADKLDARAENVCEHGDHPAPDGKRFCSKACEACEHESVSDDGCDGICARSDTSQSERSA
jgi:hypothetical protein